MTGRPVRPPGAGKGTTPAGRPYCPSAQPDMEGAVAFGIVGGTADRPRVAYLEQPIPVSVELLRLAEPVEPTEVFRFGAPCAESACQHFDGARCQLGARLAGEVTAATAEPPPCRLRPVCRWWAENGAEACRRCALVVTLAHAPSDELRLAATPGDRSRSVAEPGTPVEG